MRHIVKQMLQLHNLDTPIYYAFISAFFKIYSGPCDVSCGNGHNSLNVKQSHLGKNFRSLFSHQLKNWKVGNEGGLSMEGHIFLFSRL
ncbi:hypothetical protein GDO81_027975 [Engystomops pustulosus]|uniref:Uncharacterized protein n=1 Tax=Engystomops pustulosus TaxID=76066 RepID=A0AAV6YEK3_ENGPU|nr:hypothetical protein GDO81_027975 [Engystomops pustulosus]